MTITITWHLILMILISIFLIVKSLIDTDYTGLDFSLLFYGVILLVMWSVYGGIVWW